MKLDLAQLSNKTLKSTYHIIAMQESGEVATVLYNIINDTDEDKFQPYHKESCLDILEETILKKIQEMRTVKEDIEDMVIRDYDLEKSDRKDDAK